ncbi:MAG: hypothetical protein AAB229_06075 [Candidatus Hydrogenedentota bacterium]
MKTLCAGGIALEAILLLACLPLDPVPDVVRWMTILVGGGALHLTLLKKLSPLIPGDDRRSVVVIGLFGLLFRLTLMPLQPSLSDDAWRNIWDGRVAHAGIDPYRYAPVADELIPLRDEEVFSRINHKEYPTIYPPFAQMISRASHKLERTAGLSPLSAWKATLAAIEWGGAMLLACGLLRAGRASGFLVYAWSPLLVTEFYSSAHIDAAGVGMLAAAIGLFLLRKDFLAGACFVASVLTKLISLPLAAAALSRRTSGRMILGALLAAVLLLSPYARSAPRMLEAAARYEGNWEFNGVLHRLLGVDYWISVPRYLLARGEEQSLGKGNAWEKGAGRLIASCALLALGLAAGAGEASLKSAAVWGLGLFLLVQPTIHPWYVTWLLPLLAVKPLAGFLLWTVAAGASYSVLFSHRAGAWQENAGLQFVVMLPVLMVVAREFFRVWRGREVGVVSGI